MKGTVLLLLLLATPLQAADYRAGVARANVTPPMPFWLSGYASRTAPAAIVRTELWAKALALADGQGGRVVIVTTDVIGLPRDVTDVVADRVHRLYRLDRSQLLLNSSHAHSGPVVRSNLSVMYDLGPVDQERVFRYGEKLTADLVALVGEALANLQPAKLSSGRGTAGFGMNRREAAPAGIRIGENPSGPVDHDVPVLKVTTPDGKLRAVLFGYACHNTTLPGSFNEVDGDYAGWAQREIEEMYPGATALFMQLCGADQNPRPRGEYKYVGQHGQSLVDAVNLVLAGVTQSMASPIRTAYQETRLDFAAHSRKAFETEAKDTSESGRFKARRARLMLAAYDKGRPVRQLSYPVQALRFGREMTILALGGEVVVDYALRAKQEFAGENLVVAGYSNDVSCYIPSLRVLREGGYEAAESMIYYGQPGPFTGNVEKNIFSAIRKVLHRR